MASADIVVVGGGVVGTALAYELASRGAKVALVDARSTGRASDAGAGIVSPETLDHPESAMLSLGAAAAVHLRDLLRRVEELGVEIDASTFAECGSLVVALEEHEDPWFEEAARRVSARSDYVVEVRADEARAMFPPLGAIWRALHNPRAARVDGRHLVGAVLSASRRLGMTLFDGEVVSLETSSGSIVRATGSSETSSGSVGSSGVASPAGGKVVAVRTREDLVHCGEVVLATGAWSGGWADPLGLGIPVAPTKGQIVHVVSPEDRQRSVSWPIVQPILDFYLVPWPEGRVACGGTFEPEAGFDTRPTASGMRDLLREMVKIAPGLGQATFVDVRVGLRPTTPDDLPVLGLVPGWDNLHVCSGHGANGLMLGAYSAFLVARALLGSVEATAELEPYSLTRFL